MMGKKIAIIDYSLGNLFSVQQAFSHWGANTFLTHHPEEVAKADAIVLPGVGAFAEAMNNLEQNGLDKVIRHSIDAGKPFLGICLGMQLLFDVSEEFGATRGLGIIEGVIKKFEPQNKTEKLLVPQVGWNTIGKPTVQKWEGNLLENIDDHSFMYFVHSYYAIPKHADHILCTTQYGGIEYCSAVIKKNVVATQFHPEKSGEKGLEIYNNWLKRI